MRTSALTIAGLLVALTLSSCGGSESSEQSPSMPTSADAGHPLAAGPANSLSIQPLDSSSDYKSNDQQHCDDSGFCVGDIVFSKPTKPEWLAFAVTVSKYKVIRLGAMGEIAVCAIADVLQSSGDCSYKPNLVAKKNFMAISDEKCSVNGLCGSEFAQLSINGYPEEGVERGQVVAITKPGRQAILAVKKPSHLPVPELRYYVLREDVRLPGASDCEGVTCVRDTFYVPGGKFGPFAVARLQRSVTETLILGLSSDGTRSVARKNEDVFVTKGCSKGHTCVGDKLLFGFGAVRSAYVTGVSGTSDRIVYHFKDDYDEQMILLSDERIKDLIENGELSILKKRPFPHDQ